MFKKSFFTKRNSSIIVSVLFVSLCAAGILVQRSVSSSRVVLKDELQMQRKLLHDAETEHACHCYSPFITSFKISNVTMNSADISWKCDAPSTYQVRWGESSSKPNRYPSSTPSSSYREYTVTLPNLDPDTKYNVGPRSICKRNCTRNDYDGLVRTDDTNGKSNWTFTTLAPATYDISGTILDASDEPMSGVTVTLSGDADDETTTDSNGDYAFTDLDPGDYTVTPTKEGFKFEPPFIEFSDLNGNQTSEDFQGDVATAIVEGNNTALTTIYAAKVRNVTAKDVTLTWMTNRPAYSQVEYGRTTAYGVKSERNTTAGRKHIVQLFDFQLGTTYHARAISTDPVTGKVAYSADFTFKTPSHESRIIDPMAVFNEPNPAFHRTTFVYHLFQPAERMTIDILTLTGKTVATLEAPQSTLNEGYNKVMWDLRDNSEKRVPNGVYLYKMKFYLADNQVKEVKKSNLIVRR